MADSEDPTQELDIGARIERLETIAETLEAGDVSLERAKALREEADDHLQALRTALDVGDGDLIDVDTDAVDGDVE